MVKFKEKTVSFNIDKPPSNDQEKTELLKIVFSQSKELIPIIDIKIHCPCGKRVSVYYHAYRCFYCGVYFCRDCAKRHLMREEK